MKMRKYTVEFIGSFFLVFVACMSIQGNLGLLTPLMIGATYMAMVYAGSHVSGAHYNPAVSVAVYLRGQLALGELPAYLVAQGVGGVLAALLTGYFLQRMPVIPAEMFVPRTGSAILAEFAGTFLLVYVILNVSFSQKTKGNAFYGLAIGLAMTAGVYIFHLISLGAFNPAIAAGFCATGLLDWSDIWIYLAANFVGGAVAAFVFNFINGPE